MKILFIASDTIPHIGGKSTHILDLADGMRKNNINCDIISLKTLGRKYELLIKFSIGYLKIFNKPAFVHTFNEIWRLLLNKIVFDYCRNNSVDYISVQDAFAASAIKDTIIALKIPTVLTMHTYFGLEHGMDTRFSKMTKKLYDKNLAFELRSLGVVDRIVAVDDRIKKHAEDIINEIHLQLKVKHVVSIANFTNITKFRIPSLEEKNNFRRECGLNNSQFVVCCARRLVEKNGVIYAVQAFLHIKDMSIVLLIAGDGPQKKIIEEYIKEQHIENRVILLGSLNCEKVQKLYMASDVSIVPSITVNGLQEATSISAIEAMACGLPTIASNIGGLTQLIINDETGILVDEKNDKKIAQAIINLRNNKHYCSSIGDNARKYIEKNHSHIESARKYLSEFEKCK